MTEVMQGVAVSLLYALGAICTREAEELAGHKQVKAAEPQRDPYLEAAEAEVEELLS